MKYAIKIDSSSSLYWRLLEDELEQTAGREFECQTQEAEVMTWLRSEIGYQNKDWYADLSDELLYFNSEEDKVKFILRWL